MAKENMVYLDGQFLPPEAAAIHVQDLSIQRGYGVFDYLRVMQDQPLYLEYHLERFKRSAAELRLASALSGIDLHAVLSELIRRNGMQDAGIKLTLTGGRSPDGYSIGRPSLIITQSPLHMPAAEQFSRGLRLMTRSHQRQLPQVKTIDYLMPIYLQPLLKEKGFDDVLYQMNGMVSECPRANIFIVKGSAVFTPAENVLEGITRKRILALSIPGLSIIPKELHIDEVKSADEVFITSTTKSVLPVSAIDDHRFATPGPVTFQLYKSLQQN